MAIFAVSFHPIRHAAEVKPYASDLLVALVLLALALDWRRTPDRTLWLWLLVAFVPVALALSHPARVRRGRGEPGPGRAGLEAAALGRPGSPSFCSSWPLAGTFLGLFALFTRFQEQLALKGCGSTGPTRSPRSTARSGSSAG